jgi:hypothetical protein
MQDIMVHPLPQREERLCRVVSHIHKRTGLVRSTDTAARRDRDSTTDSLRVIMAYIINQVQEEQRRPLDLLVMDPTIQEDPGGRCGSGKVLRG